MSDDSFDRFWSLPAGLLIDRLATSPAGLSQIEAEARLARYGPNTVAEPARLDILRKIARRFAEPLVAILWSRPPSPARPATSAASPSS
jgi:Mg2+-importing ATPase